MRILIACTILILIGGIIAASYLLNQKTLTAQDLQQVQSTCAECHAIPQERNANILHSEHLFLECTTCHTNGPSRPAGFGSCAACHAIPDYSSARDMHNIHASLDCIVCHVESGGSADADRANSILQWTLIGIVSIAFLALGSNFIISKTRLKQREKKDERKNS